MSDPCDYPDEMRDHPDEMRDHPDIDDAFEAVLAGRATAEGSTALATFVEAVRHSATSVQPEPDDVLRQLFAEGLEVPAATAAPAAASSQGRTGLRRLWKPYAARLAGASLFAKVMLGSAVAVAGVTGGAATGSLPGPVQDTVADMVGSVTDIELPRSADQAAFGQDVADDARDPDSRGVDGSDISERARDNARADGRQFSDAVRDSWPTDRAEVASRGARAAENGRPATTGRDTADEHRPAEPGSQSEQADRHSQGQVTTPADGAEVSETAPHGSSETGRERRSGKAGDDTP